MPLTMGSLAKALRLDTGDKRRARVKFVHGEGQKHDRLELEQEKKKFHRKVKDITARSKEDEIIRIRTMERRKTEDLEKKMKKTEKSIEAVIRMQKNREWRKRREESSTSRPPSTQPPCSRPPSTQPPCSRPFSTQPPYSDGLDEDFDCGSSFLSASKRENSFTSASEYLQTEEERYLSVPKEDLETLSSVKALIQSGSKLSRQNSRTSNM